MKVSELFSRALALLNEDESRARVFRRNCLPLVNQLLAQTFCSENGLRASMGEELLKCAQSVSDFDEQICYNENFVSECMPYALASLLCADDDRSMSNAMGEEFERLRKKYSVTDFADITDWYV